MMDTKYKTIEDINKITKQKKTKTKCHQDSSNYHGEMIHLRQSGNFYL